MNKTNAITTVMNTNLVTITPQSSLRDVEQAFCHIASDNILVQQGQRLLGIVNRVAFGRYLGSLNTQRGQALAARSVASVVDHNIIQLSTENTINDAVEIFDTGLFTMIPIVDATGQLVGTLTSQDLGGHATDDAPAACASRPQWR
ncbi:MAG: CBS domain-containing protein [Bacteroidota bacterium]